MQYLFAIDKQIDNKKNNNTINQSQDQAEDSKKHKAQKSKTVFLFYLKYPKVLYNKQKFTIPLKSVIAVDKFDLIKTNFIGGKNIKVINTDAKWKWRRDNIYQNLFYFKVLDSDVVLPDIKISVILNGKVIDSAKIKAKNIHIQKIASNIDIFSNIIAQDLQVVSQRTKQYNNKQILTLLEIKAKGGNLEDFSINKYKNQSIVDISGNYPNQTIHYSVILPISTKNIIFSYYNINKKRFINKSMPIITKEELVSTQTDLNPNHSKFLGYKNISLIALFLLFFIIFFIRKKKIGWLILASIPLGLLIYSFLPSKTKVLKKGTKVYILPTKRSTVFSTTNYKQKVEIIGETKNYYKVLFLNQNIGWVKKNGIKN